MAEQEGANGAGDNAVSEGGIVPQVGVIAQYVKDLSFESPNAPAILSQALDVRQGRVGVDLRITPVSPPSVKMNRKPSTNSDGVASRSRPDAMVAIQANTWMPLGSETAMLAAEKNPSAMAGMPVVNMWCTHRPKLKKPVAISATTISS